VQATKLPIVLDTIRRLVRRNATANLKKILNKTHPADIANVFRSISHKEMMTVFGLLEDPETAADVLSETDPSLRAALVTELSTNVLAEIFEEMSSDDAALILGELPEELRSEVLALLKDKETEGVEELLSYEDDTAGRIMSPDYFSLPEETTAREAVKEIRKASEAEMVFYVYVIDEGLRLVGVVSLRDLVTVPPDTPLKHIMSREIIRVHTSEDQEEVARMVARYNLLAVPVVDEQEKLVGIITVDDVIDVIREEATEDILKLAGTGEEEITSFSAFRSARTRLPWLLAAFVGGVIALNVIKYFEGTLEKAVLLAGFLPVIIGMGGNIGTQSTTITVRGLATGRLNVKQIWKVVFKEIRVALLLGLIYAAMLFGVAMIFSGEVRIGLAVSLAIGAAMTMAAVLGTLLPMLFQRIEVDPAVASGPFITTTIDILGTFIYFVLASIFLL